MKYLKILYSCLWSVCIILVACDKNGNNSQNPSATSQNPTPQNPLSNNRSSNGITIAHRRGYLGQNMTIGVIDTPVIPEQPTLSAPNKHQRFGNTEVLTFSNAVMLHGTIVSLVAASSDVYVGVAPYAKLYTYGIRLSPPSSDYTPINLPDPTETPISPWQEYDRLFAERTRFMTERVDVLNMSFGFEGNIDDYTESEIRFNLPESLKALAQTATAKCDNTAIVVEEGTECDKTAIVVAAGNAGSYSGVSANVPEVLAGLPYHIEELRGHFLAVVATTTNTQTSQETIAGYSNHCGAAKDFCLAAPGDVSGTIITSEGERHFQSRGTSFAAPRVTGALAILGSMSSNTQGERTVTMQELITRLLETADKTGIYSNQDIYGQGLIDLDAATRPVGMTSLAFGKHLDEAYNTRPIHHTHLRVGPAFGDALTKAFTQKNISVFDTLNFPFYVPLSTFVQSTLTTTINIPQTTQNIHPVFSVPNTLVPLIGKEYLSLWFDQTSPQNSPLNTPVHPSGYLGLLPHAVGTGVWLPWNQKQNSLRLAVFMEPSASVTHEGYGATIQMTHQQNDIHLSLNSGLILQEERFLDTQGQGGLNTDSSHTVFVGLTGKYPLGQNWYFGHSASLGITHIESAPRSLLENFSTILSTEGWLEVQRTSVWKPGDRIGLRLVQPLRVEKGSVDVRYVVARRLDKSLDFNSFTADLKPSGRTLNLETYYQLPLNNKSTLNFVVTLTRQPNHQATSNETISGILWFRQAF